MTFHEHHLGCGVLEACPIEDPVGYMQSLLYIQQIKERSRLARLDPAFIETDDL